MCDPATVHPDSDLSRTRYTIAGHQDENLMLHHNSNHRWYYISDQMPEELLAFRQVDSDGNTGRFTLLDFNSITYLIAGVPHGSFRLPLSTNEKVSPRESVEARVIAYFD